MILVSLTVYSVSYTVSAIVACWRNSRRLFLNCSRPDDTKLVLVSLSHPYETFTNFHRGLDLGCDG